MGTIKRIAAAEDIFILTSNGLAKREYNVGKYINPKRIMEDISA
jgi:hypothetical protein